MKRSRRNSIREQLGPWVIGMGLREVSRRTGIPAGTLSQWISGRVTAGRNRPARLNDQQIEAIAAAVGVKVKVEP